MTAVLDMITDALIEIGVVDPGNPVDPGMATHALRVLNRMLDQWSIQELLVYGEIPTTYPLTPNYQAYTMGPGTPPAGALNIAALRPVKITRASVLLTTNNPLPIEIPIDLIETAQEWQNITIKQTPSTWPLAVWPDRQMPMETLWCWPLPTGPCSLILYTWNQINQFASVQATVLLPQGYEAAIVPNLSCLLAPSYGKTPDPLTLDQAGAGKRHLAGINHTPTFIGVDNALLGNNAGYALAIKSRGLVVDA